MVELQDGLWRDCEGGCMTFRDLRLWAERSGPELDDPAWDEHLLCRECYAAAVQDGRKLVAVRISDDCELVRAIPVAY